MRRSHAVLAGYGALAVLGWCVSGLAAALPSLRDSLGSASGLTSLYPAMFGVCLLVVGVAGAAGRVVTPTWPTIGLLSAGMVIGVTVLTATELWPLSLTGVVVLFACGELVVQGLPVAGIDTVIKSPVATMRVNMVGSANVLEAASHLPRCDRVVCFSTSEVFGQQAFCSSEEDKTVMGKVGEARWTYAVSKVAEEHLAIAYFHESWLPTARGSPFQRLRTWTGRGGCAEDLCDSSAER